ncbi:hypothetical protein [Dyella nitratireducens]|uniref:Transmembrane protein n=1 Tax=Dyella nitratireducens TaxID=1849580 RepID=A0ABQ1FK77_9GAMM|nr:hypothetical protein [Dyella nitratireducens]GGA19715.1 hypothetical protein GCM10010981_04650 [Dyella nitratireducens]GLQ44473.1 hypothetical protein GCM10007902_43230 [Dyella nitratireducens]
MPRIVLSRADATAGELLIRGLRYPLRGAALATCTVLALIYLSGALPGALGIAGHIIYWVAAWRYAATCLIHAANGYADPPDVGVEESTSTGVKLTVMHLFVMLAGIAIIAWDVPWLWWLVLAFIIVLPAIDMSLAFDGDLNVAFNPAHWWRTVARFGGLYVLLATINLLTMLVIVGMGAVIKPLLPTLLGYPLHGFACVYLIIFNFQLMGALVHQRHEIFGMEPEAARLAARSGQDADALLLEEVESIRVKDPRAALDLLVERLRERAAPASLHRCYRDLLRQSGMTQALLEHGQIWTASLVTHDEMPRALSLVQECVALDPAFVPDDPANAGPLAERAARMGMTQLAIHLSRGYLRQWPKAPESPRYGLLAAKLIANQPDRRTEAMVLLGKLIVLWPDHPLQAEMETLLRQLKVQTSE